MDVASVDLVARDGRVHPVADEAVGEGGTEGRQCRRGGGIAAEDIASAAVVSL